ncbi:MAG: DNA mismatch repair protein MutS [Clostridia bacterium]|nr:DNA mismatch repair protein MutS [Clostridia bacterium]
MAITPMMQQYLQIKEENPDTLLFFRLGDFYELFFDDAELVSKELELTLTGKDCGLSARAPMCGVPYDAVDTYVARLIEKGYKVAICEQMTDPAESKGLVERAVTRVVTPGTVIESNMLDEHCASYILALCMQKNRAGIAFCDVSTGEFFIHQVSDAANRLHDELARIMPREILVSEDDLHELKPYAAAHGIALTKLNSDWLQYSAASKVLNAHFGNKTISNLGTEQLRQGISAAGALMCYLTETQKNSLRHINHIQRYHSDRYMALDASARQSLELTESLRARSRRGSLLWLIDKTVTSMGSRMLRSWVEQPLVEKDAIESRLDAVSWFVEHPFQREALQEALKPVRDVERLLSRIAYDSVNARDCLALLASLNAVPHLSSAVYDADSSLIQEVCAMLEPLTDITDLLERAIDPDAPLSVKEGGIIREGFHAELDELRNASTSGKRWLSELEVQERENTGIKNLKVGFNRVFGYYIEVTKSYYDLVPARYIRKQTLAAAERFVTEELKNLEKKILGAEESSMRLEYQLFVEVRTVLNQSLDRLGRVAQAIKTLDALVALAQTAAENDFVRPSLNEEGVYDIKDGRHPVVEQSIGHDRFVPNDTLLDESGRVMIITGPNMAGKSTYMRQVALIVLLSHVGSFVPASYANVSITDRIFTRIGASDDLFGGQSTFMVEMSELSTILKFATPKSLLILDEIGRGTSTFDGLSIAWAAVEHIANPKKCGARALFATHYHELSELEGRMEGIVNYRITAMERGNEVIFLRKIVKGGADHSYGVSVAALAGLPDSLVMRARQIMARLEVKDEQEGNIGQSILDQRKNGGNRQVSMMDAAPMELAEEIRSIDVMSMSPMDAMNTLFKLVEKARRI